MCFKFFITVLVVTTVDIRHFCVPSSRIQAETSTIMFLLRDLPYHDFRQVVVEFHTNCFECVFDVITSCRWRNANIPPTTFPSVTWAHSIAEFYGSMLACMFTYHDVADRRKKYCCLRCIVLLIDISVEDQLRVTTWIIKLWVTLILWIYEFVFHIKPLTEVYFWRLMHFMLTVAFKCVYVYVATSNRHIFLFAGFCELTCYA